jgi:membrane-bound lytic murein transglycosylase D
MKRFWSALFLFLLFLSATGAQQTNTPAPDILQSAQDWINDNIDFNALPELDEDAVKQFFDNVRQRFQGEYVIDLSGLKPAAKTILSLLQNHEELQPYAQWLAAQIDYLDVADEIRIASIAPPQNGTNTPSAPSANPTAQLEREIWIKKLADRRPPLAAGPYVRELKRIFAAQNVPPELIWLAEVESSFNRTARSPMGAAGLFQLMPDTAKRFGLSLWPRDQRYQPEPSATASAKYLHTLYNQFHDWRLALAAYNDGEGSVEKLLKNYHARSYDDVANHLPAETQLFVPRVEAVILKRDGANLENLTPPRQQ